MKQSNAQGSRSSRQDVRRGHRVTRVQGPTSMKEVRIGRAPRSGFTAVAGLLGLILGVLPAAAQDGDPARTLALIDGNPITVADCDAFLVVRQVPEAEQPAARARALQQLIERRLIELHLQQYKVEAPDKVLDRQLARLEQVIRSRGSNPDQLYARLGLNRDTLKRELRLTFQWRSHVETALTDERIRQYFARHRTRFDGTQVQAAQIFRKAEDAAAGDRETEFLQQLRKQIAADELDFAEAARTHSQSPTAAQGGALGTFPYRGRMPVEFTSQMFSLQPGEIGEPFRTRFGVHLVLVEKRIPGMLSLEDVRREVVAELSEQLWNGIVADERQKHVVETLEDR